ncbi:MAG: hypothetical protein R6U50_03690 [Desulfobacterales bacterium]
MKKRHGESLLLVVIIIMTAVGIGEPTAATAKTPDKQNAADKPESLASSDLVSLDAKSAVFLIRSGKGAGKKIQMALKRSNDSPNKWRMEFQGLYRMDLYRTSEGAVHVARIDLLERNRSIRFAPSIELIPPYIQPGRYIRISGRAEVYNLDSGEKIHSGGFSSVIDGLGRAHFESPVNTIEGILIWYESRIDLGDASIRLDLETGWSDNKIVYLRSKIVTEMYLVFGNTTIRELIIAQ